MLVVQNSLLQHQSSDTHTHTHSVSAHDHLQNSVMQTGVQSGIVMQEEDLLHLPV
jgi:hypothetical protein